MSGLNNAFRMVTGALGRKARNYSVAGRTFDQLKPQSAQHLGLADDQRSVDAPPINHGTPAEDLRHSEWLERLSMQRIRGTDYSPKRF